VQREVTEYAHMSHAATKSTKIIAESLAQWKPTAESASRPARLTSATLRFTSGMLPTCGSSLAPAISPLGAVAA
jgi:hypothetical protein